MKIILLKDIDTLGGAGDSKNVADGYAKNFLIPRGLAKLATPSALREASKKSEQREKEAAARLEEFKSLKQKIESSPFETALRATTKGATFGSITPQKIQGYLKERGIEVERRHIDLPDPLKEAGEYIIKIKLAPEIIADFRVMIKAKPTKRSRA